MLKESENFPVQEVSSNKPDKEKEWEKTIKSLDNIHDRLGRPIDKNIREAVTSFIVNGFPTTNSCEGHVEKRFGKMMKLTPRVEIGLEEPGTRFIGEKEIKQRIAAEFNIPLEDIEKNKEADDEYWRYIILNRPEETPEYIDNREANQQLENKMGAFLEDFYKERPQLKRKITTKGVGPDGSFFVTTCPKGEKDGRKVEKDQMSEAKQELAQEQEEFAIFAQFMKDRYLSGDAPIERQSEEAPLKDEDLETVKAVSEREKERKLEEVRKRIAELNQ